MAEYESNLNALRRVAPELTGGSQGSCDIDQRDTEVDRLENMDRFTQSFEASARRWELIVYPSLVAFIILAAYGFYLIYNLSRDVSILVGTISTMTETVDRNMNIISDNMVEMAYKMDSMRPMQKNMQAMEAELASVNRHMQGMSRDMSQMRQNMDVMTGMTGRMAQNTGQMGRDIYSINRSFTAPFSFVEQFFPGFLPNPSYGGPTTTRAPPGAYPVAAGPAANMPFMNGMMPF